MNFRGLINYSEPMIASATVLALALLFAVIIGSYAAHSVKVAGDTITVTGSAKETVTADFARWFITLEAKAGVGEAQVAAERLERAVEAITTTLDKKGLKEIETPIASVNPTYYYPRDGAPVETGVTANRQVIVRSPDIDALAKLAGDLSQFSGFGYTVSSGQLELTYQKLPELRVKLLSGAIKDARERAEAIAKETSRSVGTLRSASSGVVQVLPQGGVEISDYGSYDTQSKVKDVMVTVRANFSIR